MKPVGSDNPAMSAPTSALCPARQCDEIDWTGRIAKQGDGMVRKLLYEAANSIHTRSRETFALMAWAFENRQAPSRGHQACHPARRHFVSSRNRSPAVKRHS